MLRKICLLAIFSVTLSFVTQVKAQSRIIQEGDTLVMSEDDLVDFFRKLNAGLTQYTESPRQGRILQLRANDNNSNIDRRFDRLENMLYGLMYQMGARPNDATRSVLVDPIVANSPNIANLQKQIDLLQKQVDLIAAQLGDNSLKERLLQMTGELATLKSGLSATPSVQNPTDTITRVQTHTVVVEDFDKYKRQIFFEKSSTKLTKEALKTLTDVTAILKDNPKLKVKLVGYASPEGNAAYNDRLSYNRANAVKDKLVANGVESDRIYTEKAGVDQFSDLKTYGRRVNVTLVE